MTIDFPVFSVRFLGNVEENLLKARNVVSYHFVPAVGQTFAFVKTEKVSENKAKRVGKQIKSAFGHIAPIVAIQYHPKGVAIQ